MKALLPLFLLSFGLPAFADEGGSSGNGGQSVVCRQAGSRELLVESFDTFEGAFLFGYEYRGAPRARNALEMALEVAARLDAAVSSPVTFTERLHWIAREIEASREHPSLPLTRDIAPFALPVQCELVQTLVFHKDGSIKVNKLAWGRLDPLGQAALYLHEAIYWHLREMRQDTNSGRTRRVVSYLLNGGDLRDAPAALSTFDATPVFCVARGGLRRGHRGFYLVPEADGSLTFLYGAGSLARTFLEGRLPGAALVNGQLFQPSGFGRFSGLLGRAGTVEIDFAASGARLALRRAGHDVLEGALSCRPYRGLLRK